MNAATTTTEAGYLRAFRLSPDAIIPTKATVGSAGYDLYANHDAVIEPGMQTLIKTDITFEFPRNTYGRIADRSSLAMRGITTMGGVVDNDYRGNVGVILRNFGNAEYKVHQYDRIAQMICEQYVNAPIIETMYITVTNRSSSGFGSSGK